MVWDGPNKGALGGWEVAEAFPLSEQSTLCTLWSHESKSGHKTMQAKNKLQLPVNPHDVENSEDYASRLVTGIVLMKYRLVVCSTFYGMVTRFSRGQTISLKN